MIQSDLKGGSLHASRAALDYERWLAVPYPTAADQQANEPKIQANLMIANSGADIDRANLLKCHISRLSKVIVLRAREEYPQLVAEPSPGDGGLAVEMEEEKVQASMMPGGEDLPKSTSDELNSRVATAEDFHRDQLGPQSNGEGMRAEPRSPELTDPTPDVSRDTHKVDVSPDSKAELTVQQKLL
jgi:DNA processing protein